MDQKKDTVVDLGSGAGNDCFVARELTGRIGRVIGLDMTEAMVDKARKNTEKAGFDNIEFILGDIEDMPIKENTANIVVSNCVLNLVPDKQKAFSEIYRILKSGGNFSISDIVINGNLPITLKQAAEMYVGCVADAIDIQEYFSIISDQRFENVSIQKREKIILPDELLKAYMTEETVSEFRDLSNSILSITVYGEKPLDKEC